VDHRAQVENAVAGEPGGRIHVGGSLSGGL
jgi:hypothetical protein